MLRGGIGFWQPWLAVRSVLGAITVTTATCFLLACSGTGGAAPGTPPNAPGSSIQGIPPAPPPTSPPPGTPTTPSGGGTGGGTGGSGGGGGSGTGGGGTPVISPAFVYVVERAPNTNVPSGFIDAFQIDHTTGTLFAVAGSPFSTNHSTQAIALTPSGAFGYVVANDFVGNNFTNVLLVYAFNSGVPMLRQTLALGTGIGGFTAVDPTGKFLYLSFDSNNPGTSGIAVFTIQSDGRLVQSPPLAHTDVNPGRITVDSHSRFLYTTTDTTNRIWGFSIDSSTGTLTAVPNSPLTAPRNVPQVGKEPITLNALLDPTGQRLFVIDNVNSNILGYAVDQTSGALTQLPGSTGPVDNFELFAPAMDPQGRFLYVAAFNTDEITGFSLTANPSSADLPVLPGVPVPTSGVPNRSCTLDATGAFLYSVEDDAASNTGRLDGYVVDPRSGALTRLPFSPVTLAGSPFEVVSGP
jgi:6-phosphogluconolactonase (cycloisomerase 2 family)